jgi:hypothetical protein
MHLADIRDRAHGDGGGGTRAVAMTAGRRSVHTPGPTRGAVTGPNGTHSHPSRKY